MEYLGARGTMIHEKNLKSKIPCQTPFKNPPPPPTPPPLGIFIAKFGPEEKPVLKRCYQFRL